MVLHLSPQLCFLWRLYPPLRPPLIPPAAYAYCTVTPKQTTPTKGITFSHIFQQCSTMRALNPGKQAHGRMVLTGFVPTIFVTNCLIQMYVKCSNMKNAFKVFDRMSQQDTVSWNTLIFGYAGSGNLAIARSLFDSMPQRDVISWNSMISCYLQDGFSQESIELFIKMRKMEIPYDHTTFAIVLKACSGLEEYYLGSQIHSLAIRMGIDNDVVTGSALIDMYAKCKKLQNAIHVFHDIPEKNWVCWSAIIAGCVQNDQCIKGLQLFKDMQKSGTATLDMYAKCGNMSDARKLFNSLPNRSLQSYNAIIVGYVRNDQGFEALEMFLSLQKSGLAFDEISLSGAFSACAVTKRCLQGVQLHGLALKSGLRSNICVANATLDMYGKSGALIEACFVFDEMARRDAVSWNAIIAAHQQNEEIEETLSLFVSMLRSRMEPDDFTYGSVLKACAGQQALNCGMEIHGRIIKSAMGLDLFVGSALVDMYCKCGMLEEAEKIHDRTEEQTMVSWNTIISGFSLQKQSEDAQRYFSQMLEMGVMPDNFTYATVLDTCANLATTGLGKQIHAQIIKLELLSDVYISSTLVDMYSKCGDMQDSQLMFEKSPKRDNVTWNAMICAYAYHGLGEDAIRIFEKMQLLNVKPNHATFVSVLRACAHMGYVSRGKNYYQKMLTDYGLDPQLEHYSCMVDLLGRSGQIGEALKLIQDMPFEADAVIWRTLLSICKIEGNVDVAERAANSLMQLDPHDSSAYVLLSNIYANAGMWGEVSEMRRVMRSGKLKKEPGCSWIEVKDEVHAFLVGDKAHPRFEEIYEQIDVLIGEMKWVGYTPDIDFMLVEVEEQMQQKNV
ncbi:Pentatricopeptide repeat-containing protein [Quillaja saponaria]|uniref:Pentatricopeptide repeat-containing protein n=1 Tax=Quillaja saponaria TaxID=32244 RepID=A0AAD7Q3Q1_QUISA|nr:Pentatricopeptide repeat-containing protein [Quillaja saponaria]